MGWPSRRTVQAPHSPRSQTRLVPVKSSWLRRTSSSVQRGSTLTRKGRAVTRRLMGARRPGDFLIHLELGLAELRGEHSRRGSSGHPLQEAASRQGEQGGFVFG